MQVSLDDAAMIVVPDDIHRFDMNKWWHWFWAKAFGQRVPTSGERAHIGNLLVVYNRDTPTTLERFKSGTLNTDARRIYVIGNLWVYDYADTPCVFIDPPWKDDPKDMVAGNEKLLRWELKEYGP